MIKTFKVKHNRDLSVELRKALQVSMFALKHKCTSSAQVKQFGLKSIISNQIIRKIIRNKRIKSIHNANLIIPQQGITYKNNIVRIPCLDLSIDFFISGFLKINQIELNSEYAFISCDFPSEPTRDSTNYIGVDLNTTGHMAVAADPLAGKVWKLNKKSSFTRSKYRQIRKKLSRQKKFKVIKRLKNREQRICKDLDHKVSTFLVTLAKTQNCGLRLENLTNIRKTSKNKSKAFKASLNNWSFYQFRTMIDYKAKLLGVKVEYIDPRYTSQADSRTGHIGIRNAKTFKSVDTSTVEHADVNAAFNIALNQLNIAQLRAERDACKSHKENTPLTDLALKAPSNKSKKTLEPNAL